MNNKKLSIILFAIAITLSMNATFEQLVKLPPAHIIKERLAKEGFNHYLEKTNIDKELGDEEKYLEGVIIAVELSLYDYDQCVKNPMMSQMMQDRKSTIIKTILQDYPQLIKKLEEQRLQVIPRSD